MVQYQVAPDEHSNIEVSVHFGNVDRRGAGWTRSHMKHRSRLPTVDEYDITL